MMAWRVVHVVVLDLCLLVCNGWLIDCAPAVLGLVSVLNLLVGALTLWWGLPVWFGFVDSCGVGFGFGFWIWGIWL